MSEEKLTNALTNAGIGEYVLIEDEPKRLQ
jgi:hypothetical protein